MPKLKLQVQAIQVVSFEPEPDPFGGPGMEVVTPRCVMTQAADTCWCTESTCP